MNVLSWKFDGGINYYCLFCVLQVINNHYSFVHEKVEKISNVLRTHLHEGLLSESSVSWPHPFCLQFNFFFILYEASMNRGEVEETKEREVNWMFTSIEKIFFFSFFMSVPLQCNRNAVLICMKIRNSKQALSS